MENKTKEERKLKALEKHRKLIHEAFKAYDYARSDEDYKKYSKVRNYATEKYHKTIKEIDTERV